MLMTQLSFAGASSHQAIVLFSATSWIVVSHGPSSFVQQDFVWPHKDASFGTACEVAHTLY